MLLHEGIAMKITMDCRTLESFKFKRMPGFRLHDMINTKQNLVGSIKEIFEVEDIQAEYGALNYRIDLYFHNKKIVIDVGEFRKNDRNID